MKLFTAWVVICSVFVLGTLSFVAFMVAWTKDSSWAWALLLILLAPERTKVMGFSLRGPKYRNRKTVVDGITFDSKKEANRWGELRLLEQAGQISELRRQVPFELVVGCMKIAKYIADAVYVENGQTVVEDCKGYRTREYRLKKKLMLACHGIEIRET